MVIRGKARGNGRQLAAYLLKQGENEKITLLDIQGTANPGDLLKSLIEMDLTAELTKSEKGLYHAQISPDREESVLLSKSQWLRMGEIFAEEMKLAGQKCAFILHKKNGHYHMHAVYERYDHAKEKMISDSWSYYGHDRARKKIEKEMDLVLTPLRNKEIPKIKKTIKELWAKYPVGKEFVAAAKEEGYIVTKADGGRPYMLVDENGRSYEIYKQLDRVKKKDIREKLKTVNLVTDKVAIKAIRMLQSGREMAADNSDKTITRSQKLMQDEISEFRKREKEKTDEAIREGGDITGKEKETDRARAKREFLESLEDAAKKKRKKDKGFGLDL
jgi:hypothetical protein